jgi:DNA modification methylase
MKMNKIYNESCLDTMSRMSDNFIDLTVTSPPYDNLRTYNNDIDKTWGEHIWKPILQELHRVTKEGGVVVWVVGDATLKGSETGTSFKQALYAMECGFNLHDTMIYQKSTPPLSHKRYEQNFEYMFIWSKSYVITFNGIHESKKYIDNRKSKKFTKGKDGVYDEGYSKDIKTRLKRNVWSIFASGGANDKLASKHPAVFPEKLAHDHIISWSNEGDVVYDPFMGSGTTAKMSKSTKRNYIGSEISEEYVKLANRRIAEMPQTLF